MRGRKIPRPCIRSLPTRSITNRRPRRRDPDRSGGRGGVSWLKPPHRSPIPKEGSTPMAAKPIPSGFHTVTPYLTVQGASKLIDFLKQAFDAKEIERMPGPDGTVGHAQLQIGDSMVMMGEASGQMKPMNCMIYLYVNDADAL